MLGRGARHVKRAWLLLFASSLTGAADPAMLHVHIHEDRFITFEVENKYESPIYKYQVAVDYPEPVLGCSLTVEVKRPEDLHPPGGCGALTTNGKVDPRPWKARFVHVEFADGMSWTPKR